MGTLIFLSISFFIVGLYYLICQTNINVSDEYDYNNPDYYYIPYNVYVFYDGDEAVYYIAAKNKIEAVKFANKIFNISFCEILNTYTVDEVPWYKWKKIPYLDENNQLTTVHIFMKTNKEYMPQLICSTF